MLLVLVLSLLLVLPASSYAQETGVLPEPLLLELKKARIPLDAVGVYIQPLSRSGKPKIPAIGLNEKTPYLPASTMKVVTTYSALEILGPAYRWKTAVYANGHWTRPGHPVPDRTRRPLQLQRLICPSR